MNTSIPTRLSMTLVAAAALLGAAFFAPSGAEAQVSVRPVRAVTAVAAITPTASPTRVGAVVPVSTAPRPVTASTASASATAPARVRDTAVQARLRSLIFLPVGVVQGHRPAPNNAYSVPRS